MRHSIFRSYHFLILALTLLIGYAWQVEPRLLHVREVVIRDDAMAQAWQGLTIVHLSDIHIEREGDREARLLAWIKELQPDLILMSGDYRQWGRSPVPAQHFLSQLEAPLGVYGVLGDSDASVSREGCAYCHPGEQYGERVTHPVILRNERRSLPWHGGEISLVGIDVGEEGGEWLKAMQAEAEQPGAPLLVLNHGSAPWSASPLAMHSLWLVGDTHGGQILLPKWLWRFIPYKPDPRHMAGLYTNGAGSWLLVNRGVGQTAWFPFRFGVLPEICVITFTPTND